MRSGYEVKFSEIHSSERGIPKAILIGPKAASRKVMQRPTNKTFDVVLAVNALSRL